MIAAILAIVAGLIAALPQILTMIEARQTKRTKEADALLHRSIDELSAGAARVRQQPPMQP